MAQLFGVLIDVDGTLVDSNDAHARSWAEALNEAGHAVSFEQVRPLIGVGADKMLPEVIGVAKNSDEGKRISERRKQLFLEHFIHEVRPFPQVRALLERIGGAGLRLIVASSAQDDELEALLKLAGVEDLLREQTSANDVGASKPDPDVVQAALDTLGCPPEQALLLGDTPYDAEAARRAGVGFIGLRCGGWDSPAFGAITALYNDPADLLAHFEESPLA